MTSLAASERAALCDLADRVGPDAPTLCEGWTVHDLVVHLLLREASPTGLAAVKGPVGTIARRLAVRLGGRPEPVDFPVLVDTLRHGPPPLSPHSLPGADALLNSVELFVHHEDVRRAAPDWQPRSLPAEVEETLWRALRIAGRPLTLRAGEGVVAERSDTGATLQLHGRPGAPGVVLRGLPSELLIHVFGRTGHTRLDVERVPQTSA